MVCKRRYWRQRGMRLHIGRVQTKLTSLDYFFCSCSASVMSKHRSAALGLRLRALYEAPQPAFFEAGNGADYVSEGITE